MDKLRIRKEVAELINSIKEDSDKMGENNPVSQMELELLLNKVKTLHEKTILLNYLNENDQTQETSKQEIKSEPTKPAPPIDLFGSELSPAPAKPKQEKKVEKKEEKISEPAKIQKPSITDIKATIGINDQFQFANELFEGSLQEYNIAIQQLNTAGSLESAIDYYSNLQQLYNWDENNETAKRLLELVDRRYNA